VSGKKKTTDLLKSKTNMQMKLDGERCQFQIATERLESATKAEKGGKLAEILQAKGEVETPNAMIETLIAEILQVYSSAPLPIHRRRKQGVQ